MNMVVEEEVSTSNQSSLYRTADIINTVIRDSNRLAAQLSLQADVQTFMLSNGSQGARELRIENMIKMYTNTFDYIDSIYIYSEFNHNMIAKQFIGSADFFQEKSWYEYYEPIDTNHMFLQPRKFNNRFPYYLSLYYPVFLSNQQKLGVVVININIQGLRDFIGQTNDGIFNDLYIIDNNDNTIIYNEDIYQFQMNFYDLYPDINLQESNTSETQSINGEQFIISKTDLQANDWSVVSFQPLTTYKQKINEIWKFIIIFFSISIFVAVIISFIISMRTYKPIQSIITALNEPDRWKENEGRLQKNELYYINKNIVDNMDKKVKLEEELDKNLTHLNKAQTLALQAQVSPHFLSNTLESMKWMAMGLTGGENDISKMAFSLSRLLRLTLGSGSQVIPISLEIELNKSYIEIMETRFKDKFLVEWDVNETLLEYQTVQLTLQPLIENAFYHGIRPTENQGIITIKISEEASNIIFEVADNGVGIEKEKLKEINHQLDQLFSVEGNSVGLRNVNQRIKLIFGESYGLQITSKKNDGTRITVKIPKYKKAT
ncbi:sensor histidine kinase [Halalkalibacter sp. APA_J-10(15)]|uniref:sensor histidine kinase n=1 Tax=Halalkalibacter sp. APA_J-10(15) TaxID=2933805 RepID=UPI001FF48981|nr:histidine kinase [Halalkalibacter sp. APA_J-10(15)]